MSYPNIIYLNSHDTGRYIQPYGHAIATPRLQRLAEEGVLFRHAFSAAPTCSPSRASLLTGRYPQEVGMHGLASPQWAYRLHDYSQTLGHFLRGLGYETVQAGVSHIGKKPVIDPAVLGYSRFLQDNDILEANRETVPKSVEYLRSRPRHPFFLEVGFNETHRVNGQACTSRGHPDGAIYIKNKDYDTTSVDYRYTAPPPFMPDHPIVRQDMANFAISARELDDQMGQIIDALEASGQASQTLIIATGDHGTEFPGAKCSLRDHGVGVYMIVKGPGGFSGGKVIEGLVQHLDLFPTLCSVLGVSAPSWLRGHDLTPLVHGRCASVRDAIFLQQGWHEEPEPQRGIRTQRYKYIRRWRPTRPPENCDNSPSKTLLQEAGFFERHLGEEEFYDLYFDPQEADNLADSPRHQSIKGELGARLEAWMQQMKDPLLAGRPVLPPGYTPEMLLPYK